MCFPPAEAETQELLETALEQAREVREQLFQCSRRGSGPVQVSPSHWRFISTQACRNDERVAFLQLVGVSAERLLCLEALDMVGYQRVIGLIPRPFVGGKPLTNSLGMRL